jgi:hypothetical protein
VSNAGASAHQPSIRISYDWYCPQCGAEASVDRIVPNRFHPCPRLRGLETPMLRKGTAGEIRIVEREDYVGDELVQLDPERGRPVMAMVTTRDDGQDVRVYAPTARAVT